MSPDVHAKVRTLAKYNRRSYSAICNDLIQYSLKQERYKDLLEEAEEEGVKMKPVEDPRTRINQPMTLDKEDDNGETWDIAKGGMTAEMKSFLKEMWKEEERLERKLTEEEKEKLRVKHDIGQRYKS